MHVAAKRILKITLGEYQNKSKGKGSMKPVGFVGP